MSESQVGAELTYDHFHPASRGGTDDASNLLYACHACNEFKGDYWSEDADKLLLHPVHDDLDLHIVVEPNGILRAITERGQIHLDRIQLNRPALVANRLERERLERIEAHVAEIAQIVRQVLQSISRLD